MKTLRLLLTVIGLLALAIPNVNAQEAQRDGDGIQVADKKKFFSFTKGRILTLDY